MSARARGFAPFSVPDCWVALISEAGVLDSECASWLSWGLSPCIVRWGRRNLTRDALSAQSEANAACSSQEPV